MTRQNLREREISVALEEISGKVSIHEIRNHLKDKGFLPSDQDAIEQWELERTRDIVQRDRKARRRKGGDIQHELISLTEHGDDGEKINYWRKYGELSPQEGVLLLAYWHDRGKYCEKQLKRYYRPLVKKHGRKIQRLITFDVPEAVKK